MKHLLFLLLLSISSVSKAQTFIGEVVTSEGYQYMKLELKEDSIFVSFPYEFKQTFGFRIKAQVGNSIVVKVRTDQRKFSIYKIDSDQIELTYNFNGVKQSNKLLKQLAPIENAQLSRFTGNYLDKNGNRAIVYARYGYLHLMSPFTEQTVSLKPINKNKFWSASGEKTAFTQNINNRFEIISITNRTGEAIKLHRSHDYQVVEDWVMVDNDSIYVNIYLPDVEGKKPACLLLPGGGGLSQMENFEYESRLFASYGIVTVTFDKASVGKSKGPSFENYTFKEKALRYQQLFQYLQSHAEVDSEKIGIHGPSEGGRLALMMGINLGNKVAFVNATAAPIMTLLEGQLYAANNYSRNLRMSEEEIVTTLMIWKNYYSGILNQKIDTTDFSAIRTLQAKYNRAFLPPTSANIPLSPTKEDIIDSSVVNNSNQLSSPVFLQYGENDERVDPTRSLQNFYQNISEDLDVTAELYKRGNHSMMTPEYQICIGYAQDKIKWLKSIDIIE